MTIFRSHLGVAFQESEENGFRKFLSRPDLQLASERSTAQFFIGSNGDRNVACGGFASHPSSNAFDLCWGIVHRDLILTGLGRLLLRYRIERIRTIEPEATVRLVTDRPTASFFARFGFEPVGIEPNGLSEGVDAVRMVAKVSRVAKGCVSP